MGLTNGVRYVFSVVASNAVGTGGAPSTSNVAVPRTLSGPVQHLKVVVHRHVVSVTWSPPRALGGAPSASYDLYLVRTPGTFGTRPFNRRLLHSRHDVFTLTSPGTYLLEVRALTSAGLGKPSTKVKVVVK
jgi:hypothetical protein